MSSVMLSESTYRLLQDKARDVSKTPDEVADGILRQQLAPAHAYIEIVEKIGGAQAMIKGTRVSVSIIVGYMNIGETPESLVENILPHLTRAQVYDALSYYHDHHEEIELELSQNTEEYGKAYLRDHLGEEGYRRITGLDKTLMAQKL